MNYFLALQNSYQEVQIGLFSFGPALANQQSIDKMHASKDFIPTLDQFLKKNDIALSDIPFIAVNQGPGPFTTLRVVITTANGISFASGIPLIGIDALEAMYIAWHHHQYPYTIILLNAFAHDVYVAIGLRGKIIFKGYKNIDQLLEELQNIPEDMYFIGNGISLYLEKIQHTLGSKAIIEPAHPDYCSLEVVGQMGFAKWQAGNKGVYQLLPLYLKQHPAEQKSY
jgi:tRNA threonylcarbamoyl adenosine modification protein YeaZ